MAEKLQESKYNPDADGYVNWVSVSHVEFGQSMYVTSPFINGRSDGYPALGLGLRITGDERDYPHSAAIHIEDIPEFTTRVNTYKQLRDGFIQDEDGNLKPLTQAEIDSSIESLTSFGIAREELVTTILSSRESTMNHQILNLKWLLTED